MSNIAYAEITATILDAMRSGAAPWVKPWKDLPGDVSAMPHNALTGRAYRGINTVLGWVAAAKGGYTSNGWLTYRQAQALGGNVRKGERSSLDVVYFKKLTIKERSETGTEKIKTIPLIKLSKMFNVEQCDGITLPKRKVIELRETTADMTAREIADRINMHLQIGGNVACYIPALDIVQMPTAAAFNEDAAALATFFHEAGHWTGHASRLDRNLTGRFGSASYAAEELVAELTSAFLCAAHRVNGKLQHPEYLANWIKVLRDDDKAFMKAASLAQAATDFILAASDDDHEDEGEDSAAA